MRKTLLTFASAGVLTWALFFLQRNDGEFRLDCFEANPPSMRLTVLIPGSKEKIPPLFQNTVKKFYEHYGVEPGEEIWLTDLKDSLMARSNVDVCIFGWPGGITEKFSLFPAARKLASLLPEKKEYAEIVLFGKSLGGIIGEEAVRNFAFPERISKLVYVATPHHTSEVDLPPHVALTNIYSNEDNYLELANNVLYLGRGVKELENAANISLPGLRHSQFNRDAVTNFKNEEKNLFEIYVAELQS